MVRMWAIVVAGVALLAGATGANATVVALQPEADAWISQSAPNANFGSDDPLRLDPMDGDAKVALLRFDLSSLAEGTSLSRATLRLAFDPAASTADPFTLIASSAEWDEATVRWATFFASMVANGNTVEFPADQDGIVEIDVLPLVQAWVDGDLPNHGFVLSAPATSGEARLHSRESSTWSLRPQLEIWSDPTLVIADDFREVSYSGNDGNRSWSLPWLPWSDLLSGAGSGDIRVEDAFPGPRRALGVSGNSAWIERYADTDEPGYGQVLMTVTVRRESFEDNSSNAFLHVRDAANNNWVTLDNFFGPADDADFVRKTYDVTAYANDGFGIAVSTDNVTDGETFWVEDVRIALFAEADIAVTKTVDETAPNPGDEIEYTITVGNLGPSPATNLVISDMLPGGLTFVDATASSGTYDPVQGSWAIPAMDDGNGAELTIRARVDLDMADQTIRNEAALKSLSEVDPNPDNDTDAVDVFVGGVVPVGVDVAVSQTASPPSTSPGDTVVVEVRLENQSSTDALKTKASHILDPELVVIDRVLSQGSWNEPQATWDAKAVDAGATAVMTVTLLVDPGTTATSLNSQAALTLVDPVDLNSTNDASVLSIPVRSTDLAFTVTSTTPTANVGDLLHYEFTVENLGPDAADTVRALVSLPAGLGNAVVSPSSGSYASGSGVWTIVGFGVGQTLTLQVDGVANVGTGGTDLDVGVSLSNSSPSDTVPGNDAALASTYVLASDLAIEKTVDQSNPPEGATILYTIVLENLGPDPASGVSVLDQLPSGVTYVADTPGVGTYDSGTGIWNVGALPVATPVVLTLEATVDVGTSGSTIRNEASVAGSDQEDPDALNDLDRADIGGSSTDLALGTDFDQPTPDVGDTLLFTVTLDNAGPVAASGISVESSVPTGLSFVDATPERGTYDEGTGAWDVGALAVGNTTTLEIRTTVDAGTGGTTLDQGARIAAMDQSELDDTNDVDQSSVTVRLADLALTHAAFPTRANVGEAVDFVLEVTNQGPDPLFGVTVLDSLGAGLGLLGHAASQGAYDSGTGLWAVGNLEADSTATLTLSAAAQPGTAGSDLWVLARRTNAGTEDPDPLNDTNDARLRVPLVDLDLQLAALPDRIDPGDTTSVTLTLQNGGPDEATGLGAQVDLPSSLLLESHTASTGGFDTGTGAWSIGGLRASGQATLELVLTAAPGTAGQTAQVAAHPSSVVEAEASTANDSTSVAVQILGADIAVTKTVDTNVAQDGDIVDWTIVAENLGPHAATSVAIRDTLTPGLEFVSASASAGTWDEASGTWTVNGLAAGGQAQLVLSTRVRTGADPVRIANLAERLHSEPTDLQATNDADSAFVDVTPVFRVAATASQTSGVVLEPTHAPVSVFLLRVINRSSATRTLDRVRLHDASIGDGTREQMDASWTPFRFESASTEAGDFAKVRLDSMQNGIVEFDSLDIAISPGKTLEFRVSANASAVARDGDRLDLQMLGADDLEFVEDVELDGLWPLSPAPDFAVDGMQSGQIEVDDVKQGLLFTGTSRNVVLRWVVPSNGYDTDVLSRVNLVNLGTALQGEHVAAMELWADDGSGTFEAESDSLLGSLAPTGALWEITGLDLDVPVGGRRLFATADIAEAVGAGRPALEGRTLQFALPDGNELGDEVALLTQSNNDGPVDVPVVNDGVLTITTVDKITLTENPIAPATVVPGQTDVPLLAFTIDNTYSTDETLRWLELVHTTTGTGTQLDLDRQLEGLTLVEDTDRNGVLGPSDVVLASSSFAGGRARFDDFSLVVPGSQVVALLVLGDVSLNRAADGDVLSAILEDPRDVEFTRPVAIAAGFPVDSGAEWTVDGMLAAQIGVSTSPTLTLGPGEGPVLGLDLVVPPNGYRDDSLIAVQIENAGTAEIADVAELRVYRDGGDGAFTPGSGDDQDLGPMVAVGGGWSTTLLNQPVDSAGTRLFFGVTVAASPTDSSTVRLRVPVGGISMASNDDGPIDEPVLSEGSLLLSSARLIASLELTPGASNTGLPVQMNVVVRNASDETILGISPADLQFQGDGVLSIQGPVGPTSLDLAVDAVDTLRYDLLAESAGSVRVQGRVTGTGESSGLTRTSLLSLSNQHRIFVEADSLALTAVPATPFTVTRGQVGAVPLSLTFAHQGEAGSGSILLRGLRVRLEDDAGDGIVPSDVLSTISVSEGSVEYVRRSNLESSGETIDLPLTTPLSIAAGEQVTLSFKVDVEASTLVPNFRLAILDGSWLEAEDATTGAPVTVVDGGSGTTFPVRSGLATVRDEAQELRLAAFDSMARQAVRGQTGASLAPIDLINPGVPGVTSDLRVGRFSLRWESAAGARIGDVSGVLQSVTLRQDGAIVASTLVAPGDSVVTLNMVTPLLVAGADTLSLHVEGDLRETAPLGTLRWAVAESDSAVAWDVNTAENLPMVLQPAPLRGAPIEVLAPADSVGVSAIAQGPTTAVLGETAVRMLSLCLEHPGDANTSLLSLESLAFELRSATREPLSLGSHLDQIRLVRPGGEEVSVVDLPGSATMNLDVPGWSVAPGSVDTIEVYVDVDLGAPATAFELVVPAAGIVVRDAVSGETAALYAADGAVFPLVSGLTQLVAPAREMIVALQSRMPSTLVPGTAAVDVAELQLSNPADPGAGDVRLRWLTVRAVDRDGSSLDLGAWVERLQLRQDDTVVASTATLQADSTTATLWIDPPLSIEAASQATLRLSMDTGDALPGRGLALGLAQVDVGVLQPASAALSVDVVPPSGESFPLYTEAASATARSLEESFANYPNPFAAGRENTRIPFFLPGEGRVTVDVYTLDGARVIRLLDGETLQAGLHEELQWDGRNGEGDVVRNGVYLMRLQYEGSTSQELLHKVAVVR